jgi:hypothetical protein
VADPRGHFSLSDSSSRRRSRSADTKLPGFDAFTAVVNEQCNLAASCRRGEAQLGDMLGCPVGEDRPPSRLLLPLQVVGLPVAPLITPKARARIGVPFGSTGDTSATANMRPVGKEEIGGDPAQSFSFIALRVTSDLLGGEKPPRQAR